MVLIHIICDSQKQAADIVDFLIDEKLMLNPLVSSKLLHKQLKNGQKKSFKRTIVMGTTKALLFNKINHHIKEKFPNNTPLVYAMPIIYMDETQSEDLRLSTERV